MSTESGHHDQAPGQNKPITIIVNGRQKEVLGRKLSFLEVVQLAYSDATINDTTIYTVTFKRGEGNKPEGTLVNGETLKLKEGMIINVTPTDKS